LVGSPENEYYKNFSTKKLVEKRELMQEMYLVEDSYKKHDLEAGRKEKPKPLPAILVKKQPAKLKGAMM
jgi:hypothetical protein